MVEMFLKAERLKIGMFPIVIFINDKSWEEQQGKVIIKQ